jgi:hypothetical protein
MKKLMIGTTLVAFSLAALRRFGPALHEWAMSKCQEMFDRMPEEFPPKRMMSGIEEIREQNSRILRRLEEEQTALAAVPGKR